MLHKIFFIVLVGLFTYAHSNTMGEAEFEMEKQGYEKFFTAFSDLVKYNDGFIPVLNLHIVNLKQTLETSLQKYTRLLWFTDSIINSVLKNPNSLSEMNKVWVDSAFNQTAVKIHFENKFYSSKLVQVIMKVFAFKSNVDDPNNALGNTEESPQNPSVWNRFKDRFATMFDKLKENVICGAQHNDDDDDENNSITPEQIEYVNAEFEALLRKSGNEKLK